ncbi:hypothetical protein CAL7716_058380 [Calothrix sp. PCC 7716]|nr:hypothetical protein CAL7716_058380 [Calothrix sp. PCC 7716]
MKNQTINKSSDNWYTPPHIVDLVVQVLGDIDLDPCAEVGKKIPAREHYTVNEDGLSQKWHGHLFLNPPYSCPGKWIAKLTEEIAIGRVTEAIALVPGATDTNWLSPVLKTQPVCFWKGRIKFLDTNYEPKLPARQSHVLIYWGSNSARFFEVFSKFGVTYIPSTLAASEGAVQILEDEPLFSLEKKSLPTEDRTHEAPLLNDCLPQPTQQPEKALEDNSPFSLEKNQPDTGDGTHKAPLLNDCLPQPTQQPEKVLEDNSPFSLEKNQPDTGDKSQELLIDDCVSANRESQSTEHQYLEKVLEEKPLFSLEKNQPDTGDRTHEVPLLNDCLPQPTQQPEKVLEDNSPFSLEKNDSVGACEQITRYIDVSSTASGSLYRYIKNIKLKSGIRANYPRIDRERSSTELTHWYWGYSYKVLLDGDWKSKTLSVARNKVHGVQLLIKNDAPVAKICEFINGSINEVRVYKEIVLEEKALFSLEKKSASGALYRYLKNKKLKSGIVASYPRVEGERDANALNHWYWGYSYEVLENGEWKSKTLSVPQSKVAAVQSMIDSHQCVATIKAFICS